LGALDWILRKCAKTRPVKTTRPRESISRRQAVSGAAPALVGVSVIPRSLAAYTFSSFKFEITPTGKSAHLSFGHVGFPEGDHDSLLSRWNSHY